MALSVISVLVGYDWGATQAVRTKGLVAGNVLIATCSVERLR